MTIDLAIGQRSAIVKPEPERLTPRKSYNNNVSICRIDTLVTAVVVNNVSIYSNVLKST